MDMTDLSYLIQDVYQMSYLTRPVNASKLKLEKGLEYISIMANKTRQEIGETSAPVTTDFHYYKEKMKFVVAPSQYDVLIGKNWQTKHKAEIDCENYHVSFHHQGIE